jgi:hypothetical protein
MQILLLTQAKKQRLSALVLDPRLSVQNVRDPEGRGQCCGSGSIGSMFLGLQDPDPLSRDTDQDPSITKQKK